MPKWQDSWSGLLYSVILGVLELFHCNHWRDRSLGWCLLGDVVNVGDAERA